MTTPVNRTLKVPAAMQAIELLGQTDSRLITRGRLVNATVLISIDDQPWRLQIDKGRVEAVTAGPFVMPSSTFALTAPEAEWQDFWQPVPPPGSHDLFALIKRKALQLNGNLQPLMANLLYFKRLLAAPRGLQ
ncbi:MAG: hypothetical protein ACRBC3_03890 [Burkholderiaceae bacterium]